MGEKEEAKGCTSHFLLGSMSLMKQGAWMQRARDDKAFRRNKSAAAEPTATIAPLEELVSSEGEEVQEVVPV
jgi:hypothetical protein